MNITTITEVPAAVSIFYDRELLANARPKLFHEKFAQVRNLPSKSGDTIKFRRYGTLAVATTPLVEGVTPAGVKLSKTDLLAKVSQYGSYVHITDWVNMTVEDATLTVAQEELGNQEGRTRDELVRDILVASLTATHAAGGSNGNTPTEITKADIDDMVLTLLGYDAEFFAPKITAGAGVGTGPIREAFWGIAHTDLIDDLEDVSNFKSTAEYPRQEGVVDGEWGSTGNVRWLVSSVADKQTTPNPDEYNLPIIAKNAYAVTDLESGSESIVKAFGSGGTSDPLNQRATAGWKMAFVARVLNDNFIQLLQVTHS